VFLFVCLFVCWFFLRRRGSVVALTSGTIELLTLTVIGGLLTTVNLFFDDC
jgi:hypothetical protein